MATPLALVDQARLRQFTLLGRVRRLFEAKKRITWADEEGVPWAGVRVAGFAFAVCGLGPGWVHDPFIRAQCADRRAELRSHLLRGGQAAAAAALSKAVAALRLGGRCERSLWAIHCRLLQARRCVFRVPDVTLARAVYGVSEQSWPDHWRTDLLAVLKGLTWLRVGDWVGAGPPAMGEHHCLLNLATDLCGTPADACEEDCPLGHAERHHHYQANVARGFLGVIERLARAEDGAGIRVYNLDSFCKEGVGLRQLGKTGRVVSVFWPAKLGSPEVCADLTPGQHDLLQAIVRERTRPANQKKGRKKGPAAGQTTEGNLVPDVAGKRQLPCPALPAKGRWTGFNGNGVRRGMGYRLTTPGGWLPKAGYDVTETGRFFEDLSALAGRLQVKVVGLDPVGMSPWVDLDRLRVLCGSPAGRHVLGRIHLRLYAEEGWEDRWASHFAGPPVSNGEEARAELAQRLRLLRVPRRRLAADLGLDPSFLSKVLAGRKPLPRAMLAAARAYLGYQRPAAAGGSDPSGPDPLSQLWEGADACPGPEPGPIVQVANRCVDRGWAVVPILPGEKKPCVRWKPYQKRRPTVGELELWFTGRWPHAGVAVVLGPVSDLFVLDVDGPEAHQELRRRLGETPPAPLAVSGSRVPYRYHLYFRHPDVATKAKATPWHPKLEFRGSGGLVVAPPSWHKSGNRYAWARGRSPEELPLPPVPNAVLEALKSPANAPEARDGPETAPVPAAVSGPGGEVSPSTRDFLEGKWAEGPGWNDRLFRAACDLKGRGVPLEHARPALLAGAGAWDEGQARKAESTIASAYSQPRLPSFH